MVSDLEYYFDVSSERFPFVTVIFVHRHKFTEQNEYLNACDGHWTLCRITGSADDVYHEWREYTFEVESDAVGFKLRFG